MNRIAWVLTGLFVVLVAAITFLLGDEVEDTTTTSVEPMTTTTAAEGVATTSVAEATTTTTAGETTTLAGETTTSSLLEGNWGEQPLVVWGSGALGWWDGSGWVQVETDTTLPVSGGEDYQVAYLGIRAVTGGGPQVLLCEPLQVPGVELADPDLLGTWPGPWGVAVSAPWELTPHLVEEASDDGSYALFAGELLAERGLFVPDPVMRQLIRTDLEGDGVNEVIVVAEDIVDPSLFAREGDYSMVFVRKVVGGEVQTAILGDSVVAEVGEGETPFVTSYGIGAVADLNGDGRMEIVVSATYYEGAGVEVWEYLDDDLGPAPRIGAGCGV